MAPKDGLVSSCLNFAAHGIFMDTGTVYW